MEFQDGPAGHLFIATSHEGSQAMMTARRMQWTAALVACGLATGVPVALRAAERGDKAPVDPTRCAPLRVAVVDGHHVQPTAGDIAPQTAADDAIKTIYRDLMRQVAPRIASGR
jgi:hypothetical protein